MKKLYVLFLLLVICFAGSYALSAEGLIYYQNAASDTVNVVPVSTVNKLPVSATVSASEPITDWATQTITLVANTAQNITSALTATNRQFIELKSHDPNDTFWVDFGADAVINASRPCTGYVYLEAPKNITISVIASTAFDIAVTEGGDS